MPERHDDKRLLDRLLTRRNFIAGGVAGAAGAVALGSGVLSRDQIYAANYPVVPENEVKLKPNGKSVLVLGGGFGGMHAACELVDRGFEVTVVEKSNLLGGKLKSWRDKSFGVPPVDDPDWKGYPRDHGIHAVWGSYNNLREFLYRHQQKLWEFPPETTIYNYVRPDGSGFKVGRQTTWPWPASKVEGLFQTDKELLKIVGAKRNAMRHALFKMASFNFDDPKQREYLDGISFPEWARSVGMPDAAIQKLFASNAEMALFDPIEKTSALCTLSQSASVSGHPDDLRVGLFAHPPGETYVAAIQKHIIAGGGKIHFNTPVIKVIRKGGQIAGVIVGDENHGQSGGAKSWRCNVCGSVFSSPTKPGRCPVCGAAGSEVSPIASSPPRKLQADYYVLAMDIPGAKEVVKKSGLRDEPYFEKILGLEHTSVYPINLWYSDTNAWERRFPDNANFFPSGFRYLGITMALHHDGKQRGKQLVPPLIPDYQNKNINVLETQIADTERVEGLTDDQIARLVHEEMKMVLPELPAPTDFYVNRFDTYSPYRVGDEARRPTVESPLANLFMVGDWVKTNHLSLYMEKTNVAAKMAVNLVLDRAGQQEGRITILPTGTPSAIIKACRTLLSPYP